jgi:ADP-ribose pyrophosphatase YjhB (NUDIX family)
VLTVEPVPDWLRWTRQLQTIAQAGLTYAQDPYDIERYEALRDLAAEIAAEHSDGDLGSIQQLFASAAGHPTPKVDVRGAVVADGRILLVRERIDRGWSLPGGWADPGESPSEAVERETREEAGLEVRAVKLVALYDRDRHGHPPHLEYIYKAIFLCKRCKDVEPRPGPETDGARFFPGDELPELSLSRVTPAQIARVFVHHSDSALPTEFD